MTGRLARALRALLLCCSTLFAAAAAYAQADFKVVTGGERGTYIQIGRDLAKFVAPAADIKLESVPSAGSAENVRRLRFEPGVKFALVQSDVFQAYLDQAAAGNKDAGKLITPLRLILPLYNEEMYFIVRKDQPVDFVHQIKGLRINGGPIGSGGALSTATVYRQMFGEPIAQDRISFHTNEEALARLVTDKSVDVAVVVLGQPAKLLADMKPEARELIKLLKFDSNHPQGRAALKTYFAAPVRAASYPNLLTEDLPSLAVKAFLVTYDYDQQGTIGYMSKFGRSLCENFGKLQAEGHPKWKEVKLEMPDVGRGWTYYAPIAKALRACIAGRPAAPRTTCSNEEQILGLCKR